MILADGLNMENLLNPNIIKAMPAELISSLLVMAIISIFSIIVYIKQRKYDPIKDTPKGIVNIAEYGVEFFDNSVTNNMGPVYKKMGPYIMTLSAYIFLGFVVGLMGLPNFVPLFWSDGTILSAGALPNPFTNLAFPLCIALLTWIMIQANSLRYNKFGYFKQFVAPIPVVGIFSMFSPLLSLSLRLFGNALAGFCLSTIVYVAFKSMINGLGLILVPVIMPFFHAYFDFFTGFIQTMVFVLLTMMDIAQEGPSIEEQLAAISLKNQKQD